jgi:predicted nucleotidyltransferase
MEGSMNSVISLSDIKQSVAHVAPFYDVKKVTLFGSYASGNHTAESDIDLLVEFDAKPRSPVTLFTVIGLKQDLEQLTGKEVDVVKYPIQQDSFLEIDKEILLYAKK